MLSTFFGYVFSALLKQFIVNVRLIRPLLFQIIIIKMTSNVCGVHLIVTILGLFVSISYQCDEIPLFHQIGGRISFKGAFESQKSELHFLQECWFQNQYFLKSRFLKPAISNNPVLQNPHFLKGWFLEICTIWNFGFFQNMHFLKV